MLRKILIFNLFLLLSSCALFQPGSSDPVHEKARLTLEYLPSSTLNLNKHSRKPANIIGTCKNLVRNMLGNGKEAEGHPLVGLNELRGTELADSMDDILSRNDMFDLWRQTRGRADVVNNNTLRTLDVPIEDNSAKRVAGLSDSQRKKVYRAVDEHPVASQCNLRKYDPQGNMGFCFGRAMTAHLELLFSGVQKDKIRKLWAVGSFKAGGNNWRYHVTTIVKGTDGQWWAIDPIFGTPVSAKQWYSKMKGFDVGGDMTLFTTEAKRFGPSSPTQYTKRELDYDGYNDYFEDLMKSYRENNGPFNGEVFTKPEVGHVGELFRDAIARF